MTPDSARTVGSEIIDQIANPQVQGACDIREFKDCDIPDPPFDPRHICPVQLCFFSKVLLGHPKFFPALADRSSQNLARIGHNRRFSVLCRRVHSI